tara:strand:+ start:334 stop:699 length:366 start_codon:yes stop_codon:yes gene_type:complete
MKYFFVLLFIFNVNLFSKTCNANDPVCLADLVNDVNDSNNAALAGMLAVGAGYYFFRNKSDEEKTELINNFKNGKGMEILNKQKFVIEIPSPMKRFTPNQSNFFGAENKNIDFLAIRYKFN